MDHTHGSTPEPQRSAFEVNARSPALTRWHSETGETLTARAALYLLSSIKAKSCKADGQQSALALQNQGFLTSASAEQISKWNALIKEGEVATREHNTAYARCSSLQREVAKLQNKVGGLWYSLGALIKGDGREERDRDFIDVKSRQIEEEKQKLQTLQSKIHLAQEAKRDRAPYALVDRGYFALTPQGEKLLSQLEVRRDLLTGWSLTEFASSMANVHQQLRSRIEHVNTLVTLFREAGFDTTKAGAELSIFTIAAGQKPLRDVLEQATSIDDRLSTYNLSQEQRLYIVSRLVSSGLTSDQISKFSKVAEDISQHMKRSHVGYGDLYLAAILVKGGNDTLGLLIKFEQHLKALDLAGLKKSWAGTHHIAACLATYPASSSQRFFDLVKQLKPLQRNDSNNIALAALSLSTVPGPIDRVIERFKLARNTLKDLLPSSGGDLPLIASVSAPPGLIAPRVELLQEACNILQSTTLGRENLLQKAVLICSGTLGETLNLETINATPEEQARLLAIQGVDRSQIASNGSSSNAIMYSGDDGFNNFTFWPIFWGGGSDGCVGSDCLNGIGAAGHPAAPCGSSPASAADIGYCPASCGSSGVCSCGSSSCGSSGSSSCGSSCGGGGCGGGGCGGGGCGGGS